MKRLRLVILTLAALTLTACGVSLPTSGPIVDTNQVGTGQPDEGFAIVPRQPQTGASPAEIIQGFLDAMQATPISTTPARQFLTTSLADTWDPQQETITYTDTRPADDAGPGNAVQIVLDGASHLNGQGVWLGAVPSKQRTINFTLAQDHGEWRIASAPNALIVPQSWFEGRFTQRQVYFFDPSGRFLVPEPVFAPNGPQLATALVRSLVAGPSASLANVVRSFVPAGLHAGLSVPIDRDGVADVGLTGDPGQLSSHTTELMAAQFSWTLRQQTTIKGFKLTMGDRVVQLGNAGSTIDVSAGAEYDPSIPSSGNNLYGIRKGEVVQSAGDSFVNVSGVLGSQAHAINSLGVALDANTAAVVSKDGRSVWTSTMDEESTLTKLPLQGHAILAPVWDGEGRLWLVDRTASGAVVWVWQQHHLTVLPVAGVSGSAVTAFLVSRDGTRFVAVIHHAEGDDVVVARVRSDDIGLATGTAGVTHIASLDEASVRVGDIGWRSPTTIAVLQQLADTALIRTYSIDGAVGAPLATVTVAGTISRLIDSPVAGAPIYATSDQDVIDLATDVPLAMSDGAVTALTYAG